jgi:2-dehydropantoate 2-reductase
MEKVVLIGLGAVGLTYAVKLLNKCDLFILVDNARIERYSAHKPVFNGAEQVFNYILPTDKFDADLVIITTKSHDLDSAILSIKNFVSKKTKIISLINGISSEDKISETYPFAKVLKSYFIGHSAVRNGNSVTQDGIGEIVIEQDDFIKEFFTKTNINFSMPEDIEYSMWLKFAFNSFSNLILEIKQIAEKKGVKNLKNFETDALKSLDKMCDEGITSMHQDILAKRKTEIDIFAGEIIKLGKKYGVATPYNQVLHDLIKIKEEDNEHSVYTR